MNIHLQKPGAWYDPAGTEFVVWAPLLTRVEILIDKKTIPMEKDELGYWRVTLQVPAGTQYMYRLDGERECPDPASLSQPAGVHGPSCLADRNAYTWNDTLWRGLPLSNMIIYELHAGCFTDTHGFTGIIDRLDYLAELGINTIELMPLGQFPGKRNWGYDGVYPFAIQDSYGGMRGFQELVDAAHARDMAVIVDVVYNHMGPEGNYLPAFGPYFTDKYRTPWGTPLNFDDAWSDGVRNYFLQNARMWLEDYHVDGLRLDAVHAIRDFGAYHFMQQLKDLALDIEHRTDRKKVLIAEIDLNDPRYINPREKGGYGLDGQWIDEFHHALHALVTGEKNAYYEDFGEMADLEKAFRQTYVYNGNYSRHRKRNFGGSAESNPFSQFIVFLQNHDQVGNRPLGDRLSATLSLEQLKLCAATVLLSPYIPLLFMGEEYGERNPFLFFVDMGDEDLIAAVRKGRKEEFHAFFEGHDFPDPQAEETFRQSCLSWTTGSAPGSVLLSFYKYLIGLRKTRPAMQGITRDSLIVHPPTGRSICFERRAGNDHICVWLNVGDQPSTIANDQPETWSKIFDSASAEWGGPGDSSILSPWSVQVFEKN